MRPQLDALLDGSVPARTERRLRAHLRRCEDCSAELQEYSQLRDRLRALPAEPLPDGFAERLHRRLVVAAPAPRRPRWSLVGLPVATAGLGCLAMAMVAAPLIASGRTAGSSPASHSQVVVNSPVVLAPQPIGSVQPALEARTSGTTMAPAASGAQSGASAQVPSAVSMTLLASQPQRAVANLSALAASGGGHSVATYDGMTPSAASGGPAPVATLDVLLPATSMDQYTQQAANLGVVLARVDDFTPPLPGPTGQVRLLVTVLQQTQPAATAAATAAPSTTASHPRSVLAAAAWQDSVVLGAARAAPWAAGAALLGLGLWGGGRWRRRRLTS